MFTIENIKENGFEKFILKDGQGTFAEVIPACGAILHAFGVSQNGNRLNVIDSYDSYEDFKQNVTSKGFLGTKLSPFVCRIKQGKYHFGNRDLIIEKFYDRGNALHGLLYDQPFRVIKQEETDIAASVTMLHEYRSMDHGYPFNYDCVVTYELVRHNMINIITEVINRDELDIPVQDGWHPYFKFDIPIDELELQFKSYDMIEFDEGLIPTGNAVPYREFEKLKKIGDTTFDNCFTVNFTEGQPICLLQDNEKNIQVEIITNESYPYLQIYTPPHRKSIAIENISGAPDAFNNDMGFKILNPGESVAYSTAYKIILLT